MATKNRSMGAGLLLSFAWTAVLAAQPPEPINLGRTSLATVRASSVNGTRGQGNPYNGIPNAFDDGQHEIHRLNYTEWLPDSVPPQWAEARFDCPVAVSAIEAVFSGDTLPPNPLEARGDRTPLPPGDRPEPDREEGPHGGKCRATFFGPADKLLFQADFEGARLPVAPAVENVVRVRLTFDLHNLHVADIRILGRVPDGVAFTTGSPRFESDPRDAEEYGRIAFDDWFDAMKGKITTRREDLGQTIAVIFECDGVVLYRAEIDKRTLGILHAAPRARWTPLPSRE